MAAMDRTATQRYLMMAAMTLLSSVSLWWLRKNDGESVSKGTPADAEGKPRQPELA
jgi:hypothetical protein